MIGDYVRQVCAFIETEESISLHDMLHIFGRDAVLMAAIVISILNIILAPLPINSFVLGIPMMGLALAYMLALNPEDLNFVWARKSFGCARARPYMLGTEKYIGWMERGVCPRLEFLVTHRMRPFAGLAMFIMALVVFLPIPFANIPGSIGIILMAAGLLQRDGICLLLGYVIAALHIGFIAFKIDVLTAWFSAV